MRRLFASLVSCTLAALVHAGEAPVLFQVTIADGPLLVQHFQAGTFGRLWADPTMTPLKSKLDEVMPMAIETLGFSPFEIPAALSSAQFTMFGLAPTASKDEIAAYKKAPDFQLQAGLGKLAAPLFAKLKEEGKSTTILGAAEALIFESKNGNGKTTLVRLGEQLILASQAKRLLPSLITAKGHDFSITLNGQFIRDTVLASTAADKRPQAEAIMAALHRFLVPIKTTIDIHPHDVTSRMEAQTTLPFMIPIDLTLCRPLPANAYSVYASAIDGKILWNDLIRPLLAAAAQADQKTPEAFLAQADQQLVELGISSSIENLISGMRGTTMMAQTPGAPLPGYTLAIPRSPSIDQALGALMKLIESELPGEGMSLPISVPNLPVPLTLICDATHWVATSDAILASTWTTTKDGGWLASPLGKLALEKNTKETFLLAVSDSAAELRAMQGYLSLMMGALPLEPKQKQAVMRGFSNLIANAGLTHEVMYQKDGAVISEGQSMVGGSSIAVVAIIAAIAIPNLLESRVVANEAAAATTLKSGVFPAQVQFQGGGYRDLDHDNVGEFGFFHELSGGPVAGQVNDQQIHLMTPTERWNKPLPEANGYRFAMFLADGKGGAFGADDKQPAGLSENANEGERYFIAYAWPIDEDSGRRAFAITSAGMVYATLATDLNGEAPTWNTLFGGEGKSWKDEPEWLPYDRNSNRRRERKNTTDGGPPPAVVPDEPAF
jgi:type II secretory pathway pseudopilin PulG